MQTKDVTVVSDVVEYIQKTLTCGIFKVVIESENVTFWPHGWGCDEAVTLNHGEFVDFAACIRSALEELE